MSLQRAGSRSGGNCAQSRSSGRQAREQSRGSGGPPSGGAGASWHAVRTSSRQARRTAGIYCCAAPLNIAIHPGSRPGVGDTPDVLDRVARLLERPLVIREPFAPLDAIVVLGAPLGPGGALSPVAAERAVAAAALWRAGGGRIVVATGGVTGGAPRAEADAIAEALGALGVPGVLTERASRTTRDNARLTRPLLEAHGVRSLWLVTQPFHGRRGARLFRRAGFDAHVWHIDDSVQYRDRRRAVRWLVREYAAWARLWAGLG